MLIELRVADLGVIEDVTLVFGPGLTALTGETGAGKTLLVDAIQLLVGGPADASLVRPGATEAVVEGRFGGGSESDEIVLSRIIPATGRSRSYVDGRMVPQARLAELGRELVDIHGQHAHQSLLSPARQRDALDRAGGIDRSDLDRWRLEVRSLHQARDALGGDAQDRARQLDLLSYQLQEIEAAAVTDPDEDRRLAEEEEILADAAGLAASAGAAWQALTGDDGVVDRVGTVVAGLGSHRPLSALQTRLLALQEELHDVAGEARVLAESVEEDPRRLEQIGERRRALTELRRKYGPGLEAVIAYREELRTRVEELASHDRRAAEVEAQLEQADKEQTAAAGRIRDARRRAAPVLARAIESELRNLAMPRARIEVEVGPDPATESVTWMLGANPGQPMLPLARAASGGELARTMLASRQAVRRLSRDARDPGPVTLVFDEVDAGIGGEAAHAVGRALAAIGADHQVLVVTHLAQVAAAATSQITVTKTIDGDGRGKDSGNGKSRASGQGDGRGEGDRTVARAMPVEGEDRVVELARMLSGRPDSDTARRHARELLGSPSTGSRRR